MTRLIAATLLLMTLPFQAGAEPAAADAAAKGLALARAAEARDAGYGDVEVVMTMTLRNKAGDEALRSLRSRVREREDGSEQSLIVFDEPRDVAGTALLTHERLDGDDDRWLYLPALKRVKRIAGSGQSGAFMGSEFSFEDLGGQSVEKYDFRWLRDEDRDGMPMHVLERRPRDENSGYVRQIVWMDQAELRLHRVEFYDRRDQLLKTLSVDGFVAAKGDRWRPQTLTMVNHQNGKSTVLAFSDYRFDNGFSDADFDDRRLANVR